MNTFLEQSLLSTLGILLAENEGVVIDTPKTEALFDKKSVVFKIGNEIIVDPYLGTAEVGEIIAVGEIAKNGVEYAASIFLEHLPSPRDL